MKFLAPQALLLLLALPLLAAAYMRRQAKPPLGLPGVERRAPRAWQRHLPAALYGMALGLGGAAADARPRRAGGGDRPAAARPPHGDRQRHHRRARRPLPRPGHRRR